MEKDPVKMVKTLAERQKKAVSPPTQLELWSDKVRGLPNTFARSALFTASSGAREKLSDKAVYSVQGFELTYNGEELRQDDLDVFLQLVHMTREQPLGTKIEVSGYQILTFLKWGTGGRDYDRLSECVTRLARSRVEVKTENIHFIGGLLPSMTRVGAAASSRFSLWLDPQMIKLFGENEYSKVDWEGRLKLTALAKWLHGLYCTHREPLPYKVETLHGLCGSKQKELRAFKQKLRLALEELVKLDFLDSYEFVGDLVVVRRATNRLAALAAT